MPAWWSNKSRPKSKANRGAFVSLDLDEPQGQQRGYRSVDPVAFARGRNTPSGSDSILNEDRPFMSRSLPREHQKFFEVPVSSVREDHLHRDQPSTSDTSCSHGRRLSEDIFVPRTISLSPGPKGNVCALNNGNSREFGFSPRSPVKKMDGLSPLHPLPLPPAPAACSPLPPAPSACSPLPSSPSSCLPLPSSPTTCSQSQSQWKNGKLLGSGTFGQVYLGFYNENGQFCAIKEVQVTMDDPHSKEQLKQLNQAICPAIRPPPDSAESRREALQAQLEEERRLREEMSRKMEEDRQRMEVDRQKMEHMFQWMQSLSEKMGQPMPKMLFPTPPPPTKSIGGIE